MQRTFVKVSSKHQLTLPTSVSRRFPGTSCFEVNIRGDEVVLRPAHMFVKGEILRRVREKIKSLGLHEDVVEEAVSAVSKGKQ